VFAGLTACATTERSFDDAWRQNWRSMSAAERLDTCDAFWMLPDDTIRAIAAAEGFSRAEQDRAVELFYEHC
jgi:hypothetical protein